MGMESFVLDGSDESGDGSGVGSGDGCGAEMLSAGIVEAVIKSICFKIVSTPGAGLG